MSLNLKKTTNIEDMADFTVSAIKSQLQSGKRVLLFLAGGSAISVEIKIAEILRNNGDQNLLKNLTVTLTDERYGELGHVDSNWQQLAEKGFILPGAKLIPVLNGEDRNITVEKFNKNLNEEFTGAEYKIGLFGIGPDGHTAGILPESEATQSEDLAFGYDTATFSRITMTFKAIEKLDEVVVWAQGENKWWVIKDLMEKNINLEKQPAQILKKVPLLMIFSDYVK